ncbi:MAG: ROK family protein [Hadesarchaea archaeon]|nr:ROK family protein [Hadesarchaea archaeon]
MRPGGTAPQKDTKSARESYAIGVDVGGTKIASALMNSKGKIIFRIEEPTTKENTISAVLSQIAKLIKKVMDRSRASGLKIKGIGIACATLVEKYDDKIGWSTNIPQIQGSVLKSFLRKNLGTSLPIFAVHDHVTPVLGEQWVGAARGAKNAIYIILGTGVGSSILIDEKPYDGVGLAGSIGWMLLGPNFMNKVYGEGCFESLCSGTGIARRTIEEIRKGSKTILMDMVKDKIDTITAKLVFDAARKGDSLALKIVQETATYVGIAVSNLISTLAPEVVVIGGGVGQSADLLMGRIKEIVGLIHSLTWPKKLEIKKSG